MTRHALEQRWLTLTRETMPALSASRGWPVRNDHCFQRILLDTAVGGVWYAAIPKRPAYAHADTALLTSAVELGEAVIAGEADLVILNRQSLAWRGKKIG
ncbi:hypothetical protein [Sphingomonas sp. Mn802worker]|uniref:hypothetical protein n=1 Tax=Sphingomonas sp. Mn802worker TaxID=629773 RepID=UPI00037AFF66|nr:hypothetical protein [Sphingomonas sp. Mn802worker]